MATRPSNGPNGTEAFLASKEVRPVEMHTVGIPVTKQLLFNVRHVSARHICQVNKEEFKNILVVVALLELESYLSKLLSCSLG